MIQKVGLILFIGLVTCPVYAAAPQADPQIYPLAGRNKNQVFMLSNSSEGKIFAEYQDYDKSTVRFFNNGQRVWIRCGDSTSENKIERIHTSEAGLATTVLSLEINLGCQEKPVLLSNHPFPRESWVMIKPSRKDIEIIRTKLLKASNFEVTKITTKQKGDLFLVLDPSIPASYDEGGHRLLDENFNEISMVEGAPLTPLIDIDGDSVPEFFYPSSDGLDAWLYRLYPRLDRKISLDRNNSSVSQERH